MRLLLATPWSARDIIRDRERRSLPRMRGRAPIWQIDQRKGERLNEMRESISASAGKKLQSLSCCLDGETHWLHNLKSIEIPRTESLPFQFHSRCSSPAPGSPCTPRRSSSERNLQHRKADHDQTSFALSFGSPLAASSGPGTFALNYSDAVGVTDTLIQP